MNLVGRERELAVLDQIARSNQREVVVVSGEPGIGKTRLLEELAKRVAANGGTAVWGRTWEVGLTPAFWPWIQVLTALEAGDDRAPPLGSGDVPADSGNRLSRFADVVAYLLRRSSERPLALLFDDLHAADLSSMQLIDYVLPGLVHARVIIAIGVRDGEANAEISAGIARIMRGARRLPLGRLGHGDVGILVGDRADRDRVFELSEGNPLFVEELVASAADGELRLPPLSSVREVIRQRVARLPAATRELVIAGAIVGRDFHGRIVADMIDGIDSSGSVPRQELPRVAGVIEIGTRVQPALTLGMVIATGPDRYRFSHALVAEAIVDELEPSDRAQLHLRAAKALERGDNNPSALAHHWLAAGHLAPNAAVAAVSRAAKAAMFQLAFEDAAELLARALDLVAGGRQRAELLCMRAEALQHAARHAVATPLCDEAAAIARALGDGQLLARIALVRGLEFRFGRTDPHLVEMLEEALAALGDESVALRARLLARLAAAEQPSRDPMQPVARAFAAIELASGLSDRDRLDVTYVALAAIVEYVEPARVEPLHHEVLALARGVDRWIAIHTRLRLCFSALESGDRRTYETRAEAFGLEAHSLGLPRWLYHVHMLAALTAILDGRFDDAERDADEARRIAVAMDDANSLWLLDVHVALRCYVRTLAMDPGVRARLANYASRRATVQAWLAAHHGEHDAARAALAEFDRESLPVDPDMLVMAANAIVFVGTVELAGRAYAALMQRKTRIVVSGMVGACVLDIVDRQLLRLAATLCKWDAVDSHAEAALAHAASLGSAAWIATIRADWADALAVRGWDGDAVRAAELRGVALRDAERFAMPGLIARCQQGAISLQADAPQRTSGRVEVTRAGELWHVRGLGDDIYVKDSRGMQMLAKLIEAPGRELHVLELSGSALGADSGVGPALDAKARAQYRARVAELIEARDRADAWGDRGRAEQASEEIEALTAELERAFGLGGRERRIGAAGERARTNVQRRITHAVDQIRAASLRIGDHIAASLKTGMYCSYCP